MKPSNDDSLTEKHNDAYQLENVATPESTNGQHHVTTGPRKFDDGLDHEHEPRMSTKRFLSLTAMAFLWTGSQIPLYFFGSIPPLVYSDIGGADRWTWFVLGCILVIGMIVSSTAHTMNTFIAGMVINGIGAGINELTALAATSEMAPTRKRGTYVAALIFTIIPFCPSVVYAQLIAAHAGWRYCGLVCGAWAAIGTILTAIFYFPPPRQNSSGLSKKEIVARIDFVGGFLSIVGMILFLAGLQWGGYQYPWKSAHVLVPLLLGAFLLIGFVIWEIYGAKYPMFPSRLRQEPRILALTLVITAISGSSFFSLLLFWPTQAYNVYGHDPVGVGLRGLPIGFSILVGACIILWLLSALKGRIRELMVVSSVLMTAGVGAMAALDADNLHIAWGILVVAGLGIGGIVVPASIITTIICPDDLLATITALTLSIRVIGGAVGYAVYYNVFYNKFIFNVKVFMAPKFLFWGVYDLKVITMAGQLTGASLLEELKNLPGVAGNQTRYDILVRSGQLAFAASYKYVYLVSIAFGALSIIAALFLGNIEKYMDDHVAVVIE